MTFKSPHDSWGIKLTIFFLKCCGFWPMRTVFAKKVMNFIFIYSVTMVSIGIMATSVDTYMCYGTIDKFMYSIFNLCFAAICSYKIISISFGRQSFMELVLRTEKYYWSVDYDEYGTNIMQECLAKGTPVVIFGLSVCHIGWAMYHIEPLFVNQGRNESDRELPFRFYISFLPITLTPWYEILYVFQIFLTYPCCVTYFCFDNLLCEMNITLFGQFRILQHDIREICPGNLEKSCDVDEENIQLQLIHCVQKHQELIMSVECIKDLYRNVMLGVVIVTTFLLCIEAYMLLLGGGGIRDKCHFFVSTIGSITSLYFYTLTCDDLAEASIAISDAAYDVRWFLIRSEGFKKQLMNDLTVVIMRSQRACSLTVGGFAPVTLQTFTSICNTAFSFLTLMRQSVQKKLEAAV